MARPGENIPNPDPSLLTTEQLFREINALKELVEVHLATIDHKLAHARELNDEKFVAVSDKFIDNKIAVDKAFEASEKAMAKTETTFTRQIEASDARIGDVKERLTILESRSQGKTEGIGAIGALVMGAVGATATLIAGATLIYNIFHR
jgi:hypothetical protein